MGIGGRVISSKVFFVARFFFHDFITITDRTWTKEEKWKKVRAIKAFLYHAFFPLLPFSSHHVCCLFSRRVCFYLFFFFNVYLYLHLFTRLFTTRMILFIHVHLIFIDTRIMKFYIIGIEISSLSYFSPPCSPLFFSLRIVSNQTSEGDGRDATLGDELLINSRQVIKLSKYRWI